MNGEDPNQSDKRSRPDLDFALFDGEDDSDSRNTKRAHFMSPEDVLNGLEEGLQRDAYRKLMQMDLEEDPYNVKNGVLWPDKLITWESLLRIFYRSDVSVVGPVLDQIALRYGRNLKPKLYKEDNLWKFYFKRDFSYLRELSTSLPLWITQTTNKEMSPWMRYYTISRIVIRTLSKSIISHTEHGSSAILPMTVEGTLVGTSRVRVKLIHKEKYRNLFKPEYMVDRESEINFDEFVKRYYNLIVTGHMKPDLDGLINAEETDTVNPVELFFQLIQHDAVQDMIDINGDSWGWEYAENNGWMENLTAAIDDHSVNLDGFHDTNSLILQWLHWYANNNSKISQNYVEEQLGYFDIDDFKDFEGHGSVYFQSLEWYGKSGVWSYNKLLVGSHMEDQSGLCQFCLKDTQHVCQNCQVSLCSEKCLSRVHAYCNK